MPGFLFALKSQPHLERLSLQHSLSSCLPLFSGFVFTSYTNHHLICPPKGISSRRDTCLSSVPGTMSGWHRISAQPFQEGGQEGKPWGTVSRRTSEHNLGWKTWGGHMEAVICKLRTNGWWEIRHLGLVYCKWKNKVCEGQTGRNLHTMYHNWGQWMGV